MKKLICCMFASMLMLAAGKPCFAADSPWNGTWKLNEAKSKMTGSTVVITQQGAMYALDAGAVKYTFACDGKDYRIIADRTIACTGGPTTFTEVVKIAGKPYSTTTRTISADGKTMTEASSGTRPDGSTFNDTETSIREGVGTGLAGKWKSTQVKDSAPSLVVIKINGDVMHYEESSYKEVSDAKLDGTPSPITGGTAPPGLMVSNKAETANKVSVTVTLNGKVLGREMMTLNPDGKSYTDVIWVPGKESEKRTFIYDKQ